MLISSTPRKLSSYAPIKTYNTRIEPTGVSARGQRNFMYLLTRSFNMFLYKPVSHSNLTEFERGCLWLSPKLKDWRDHCHTMEEFEKGQDVLDSLLSKK